MKTVNEMSLKDIEDLENVLNKKKVSSAEAADLGNQLRTYVDNRAQICHSCAAQIRFAHSRLKTWYNSNKEEIEKLKQQKQIEALTPDCEVSLQNLMVIATEEFVQFTIPTTKAVLRKQIYEKRLSKNGK